MKYKLSDISEILIGRTPPRKEPEWFSESEGYKWISIKDMGNENRYIYDTSERIIIEGQKKFNIPIVEKDTLLLSFKLTVGRVGFTTENMLTNEAIAQIRVNESIVDKLFLYYYLKNYNFNQLGSTSSIATAINSKIIKNMEIDIPEIAIQKKIATALDSIDKKIEINNTINKNLEEQAQALYDEFFSENNKEDGDIQTLDQYCNIFTGKKNANAAIADGKYKFFTCAPDFLLINSFIYDGSAIIVSGNGAYTGRTRFYSGKFDLYQRTYACTLKDNLNPDYIYPLYWFVKLELSKKIMGGTRGSAIPYIVMNDLAKYEFVYNKALFDKFVPLFKAITQQIQLNEHENENLSLLRDSLLPKLMSGEIDVSDLSI